MAVPDRPEHPPWCDRARCRIPTGGPHVGERLSVAGEGGELAALWQEGSNGGSSARLSTSDRPWQAGQLQELSMLAARLADRLARDGRSS